jgi:hypothetical protein
LGQGSARLSSPRMAFRPFTIPAAKGKSFKTIGAIDVAARYFVYKLYEATDRRPNEWASLSGIGELRVTVERAVERGWVILEGMGKLLERKAALTDEGRRLARKGR